MALDGNEFRLGIDRILAVLGTASATVLTWLFHRANENHDRVAKLETEHEATRARMDSVEDRLKGVEQTCVDVRTKHHPRDGSD